MIRLETPRLILRDFTEDDLDFSFRLKSDRQTMFYLEDIALASREEARRDLEGILADRDRGEGRTMVFLLIQGKDGQAIGSVGYTVTAFTPGGKLASAGYFMLPQFWGRGVMTEAFARTVDFAFGEHGVHRMECGCLKENAASERVMRKCGFVKEADRPQSQWHAGQWKDRVDYRLLRAEWQALREGKALSAAGGEYGGESAQRQANGGRV